MNTVILHEFNSSLEQELVYKNQKDKIIIYSPPQRRIRLALKSVPALLSTAARQILLPSGWPHSVSDDYINYQIWDSAQAFCSGITGILATRAILIGVGVGNSESKPLSATITWILKDGTGMLGRIVFVWLKGKNLDTDCKKWRLFADILNDVAMSIQLTVPNFVLYSKELLCIASVMTAIVGVAGGATRAAITQHQALRGNTGDVSAKDGSQETFVNLCASIFGVLLLNIQEDSQGWDWILFILFCLLHLFTNYKAVKSLNLKTLNEERYILLLTNYFESEIILPTRKINDYESVFLGFGLTARDLCNFNIRIGCSLNDICLQIPTETLQSILKLYESDNYLLIIHSKSRTICILLKTNETSETVLLAYFHAIYYGLALSIYNQLTWKKVIYYQYVQNQLYRIREKCIFSNKASTKIKLCDLPLDLKRNLQKMVKIDFINFKQRAQYSGWDFNTHQMNVEEWRYKV